MNTRALKQFAQDARRQLREQVAARMAQVLSTDSVEIREQEKAVEELERQIKATSREAVIDTVAYTWFNRFCALRFMDVNHYTRLGIVSPVAGYTQPEILQEAKQGVIDESFPVDRQRVFDLLGGQIPAAHPQQEAYRLLLVGACNAYHKQMPFLFEPIADYTELLMPGDLLSENSILQAIRNALTPETCRDVEVIGWLYQYYISERKDEVFANLKQNQKIQPQDIPAATQLFTPHWIVCYLVENSLGRLWLLNRPYSRLAESMEFYIAPGMPSPNPSQGEGDSPANHTSPPLGGIEGGARETDFLRLNSPEEIKMCDPACGSGHLLTYSFDLLYRIYEEAGYDPVQIPQLILEKNLYGIEIDQRAGALAAFALAMKAREKDRRFFRRQVTPNICVLKNVRFTAAEINEYMDAVGRDLFTNDLWLMLKQFENADNYGSLIRPQVKDVAYIRSRLAEKGVFENLFLHATNQKVETVLTQAEYLSQRYHVVVANPPYMGGKGMNTELKAFLKDKYTNVKSDLFSAFIIRNLELALPKGQLGYMSPFVWMFISSYEKLRNYLIENKTITSLIQLEYSGFEGATVPICTFTLENARRPDYRGGYIRLSDFRGAANQAPKTLEAIRDPDCGWFYRASATDFKKIPGSPIVYWVSEKILLAFETARSFGESATPAVGLNTGDNNRFLRLWSEISFSKIKFGCRSIEQAKTLENKWFPYNKGGEYRKWYGNRFFVINWKNDGEEVKEFAVFRNAGKHWSRYIQNLDWMFKESLTWSFVSSSYFGVRYSPEGSMFDVGGSSIFSDTKNLTGMLGFLCSKVASRLLIALNPTLNFQVGNVASLPIIILENEEVTNIPKRLVELSNIDWDSYETSWDFADLLLLRADFRLETLADTYVTLRQHWQAMTQEMQQLEEENNRIFIEAYGLQDELTPDIPLHEITLTCNPHYRYPDTRRKTRTDEEREALLLADTMREFISYAVGCMFGRYSLDKPGLILANQGETAADYQAQTPHPTFPPDEDNVIPILDEGWFSDDITERFRTFLRATFGDEHYEENLTFLEQAIGRDIRSYLLKGFYKDHVKTYKKRPIYWLFSSPKGSFNALIYMHRYRPDTVSVVLNDYLREYRVKLNAHQAHLEQVSISGDRREKTQALKALGRINKTLAELKEYEDEILYPLATQRIEIDLDDGVKVNYPKFGQALKKL